MTANFFLCVNVDHLGNVRLTYADSDGDGSINPSTEIISEKNYYPFGLQHKGYNFIVQGENSAATQYGYNGMEKSSEFGLETLDFGARNYDPAIGRWMNIDPLAEQMRRHSPYNYAFNNPVFFIDPDGMRPMAGDFMLQGTDEEDEDEDIEERHRKNREGAKSDIEEGASENNDSSDSQSVSSNTVGTNSFVDGEGNEMSWNNLVEKFSNTTELKKLEGKSFDRPDPDSFKFNRTGLWQEAATTGLNFNIVLIEISPGGYRIEQKHSIVFNQAILFGVPGSLSIGNTDISSELAAEVTAEIVDRVMSRTSKKFGRTTSSQMQVEQYFRAELIREYPLSLPGARVQFNAMNFKGETTKFRHTWF